MNIVFNTGQLISVQKNHPTTENKDMKLLPVSRFTGQHNYNFCPDSILQSGFNKGHFSDISVTKVY
jgi:hypothetical protein